MKRGVDMKKPPDASSERAGIPGLDIFKIAGQSISDYVPSLKIRGQREIRCPYTSIPEQMLALYLEYHPHVNFYQRGDASEAFVRAHHLHVPLGTPYLPLLASGSFDKTVKLWGRIHPANYGGDALL
jgi:hypothetical protein